MRGATAVDAVTTYESSFETIGGMRGASALDVIPAGPARRRWTAEAKARIVAESMAPGANVSAVARRHEILPQQLYAWRRKVGERLEAGGSAAFVPALVQDAPRLDPRAASAGAEIRIEVGGVSLFVPGGASADHIERVLLAVRMAS